jgi:hypothetical protein
MSWRKEIRILYITPKPRGITLDCEPFCGGWILWEVQVTRKWVDENEDAWRPWVEAALEAVGI